MVKTALLLTFFFSFSVLCLAQEGIYNAKSSLVVFKSDAPLEDIKAESKMLRGVIKPATKEFSFSVDIESFTGFNSDLQRIHFQENYMDEPAFPKAKFQGKIIEDNLFDAPGTYSVRAKGMLDIHGVQKERIIKGTLKVENGTAHLESTFSVPLSDHNIEIPKLVNQKIAEDITVTISIEFVKNSKS